MATKIANDGAQTSWPNKSPSEYSIRIRTSLQTGPTEGVLISLAYITLYRGSRAMRGPPVSSETSMYICICYNLLFAITRILKPHPRSDPPGDPRRPENPGPCSMNKYLILMYIYYKKLFAIYPYSQATPEEWCGTPDPGGHREGNENENERKFSYE